ncbi:MAG: ribonuclease D [Lysobacteraceae bacterium]|nr:MAG: ribonuclease D [Xanthomonadaceae bacterium]
MNVQWIDQVEQLQTLVERWMNSNVLAMDTEFIRERTFYPIPALLQICDGEQIYLIDLPAIGSMQPLLELMTAEKPIKVMHSASEDLELILNEIGAPMAGLFDTQIAAGLVGLPMSMSYAKLVEHFIGVELAKDQTRSNWLQRPLTENQLFYAAADVEHLLPIAERLRAQLADLGRESWFNEDCAKAMREDVVSAPPERAWRRLGYSAKLSPQGREALRLITQWRDEEARRANRPRGHIMADPSVREVAEQMPESMEQLSALLAPSPRRRHLRTLWDLMHQAWSTADEDCPPPGPEPLTSAQRKRVKEIRAYLANDAEQLGIEATLIARRRDLEHIVRFQSVPKSMQGWRIPFAERLCQQLSESPEGH